MMGSLHAEGEEKLEMDDSGCIQDETPPSKQNGHQGVHLLDLSDDVLLLILRFLAPRDLKALGYTCPRLGALVLDRSLWQAVDARAQPCGRARLRWYLTRALHAGTRELLVAGYAREAGVCLGHVNQTREDIEAARLLTGDKDYGKEDNNNTEPDAGRPDDPEQSDSQSGHSDRSQSPRIIQVPELGPNAQFFIDNARDDSPTAWAWPRAPEPLVSAGTCPGPGPLVSAGTCPGPGPLVSAGTCPGPGPLVSAGTCPGAGPQFTLTASVLRQLADTCPALASLGLEYCNINCNTTSITQFPSTLKKLSLRGSKCYNLPLDRSFLFKIQDTMPDLESLDVSECEWMEPASFLPLSKLLALKHLYARDCLRLTEFVAYASLATRYGFTKLESLDLRGSPVGDSEVSALGWLPALRRLWLAPARPRPAPAPPAPAPRPGTPPGDQWEAMEPDYFKIKDPDCDPKADKCEVEETKHTWQASVGQLNGVNFNSTQSSIANHGSSSPSNTPFNTSSPTKPSQWSNQTSPRQSKSSPSQSTSNQSSSPNQSNSPNQSKSPNQLSSFNQTPASSLSSAPSQSKPPSQSKFPNQLSSFNESPAQSQSKSSSQSKSPNQLSSFNQSSSSSQSSAPSQSKSSSQSKSPNQSSSPSQSKAIKRKPSSPTPGPSKRRRESDSSSDDDVPLKCLVKGTDVNNGASTSREKPRAEERQAEPAQNEAQPRHHVLYVNVGQQVHAVYRLSLDNEHIVTFNRNPNVPRINTRNIFLSPPTHLDASSLVTDSAIRRFGRADGEDINYVHIGPNGPYPAQSTQGARPDRSSLTHLSVTGFRHITDSSLNHLATSAPFLRFLDLTATNVTDAGVANFRSLRPECEVIYSKYVKRD